ncbi:MAG TPA: hypothetical protein VGF04_02455 [Solirubrobacterales bacterium]
MKGFLARHPSTAVVISIVALVMATVGTGYAALKLPKNAVGTKQLKKNSVTKAKIKKNAVTGAKVKKHTLTGSDINLKKLGTVPSAEIANTIPPAEATHLVGSSGQPGFETGSSNFAGLSGLSFEPVGFYKDHEGIVHLQGMAQVGEAGPLGVIFRLPPGYRPASGRINVISVFCFSIGPCATDDENDQEDYNTLLVAGSNTSAEGFNLEGGVISTNGSIVSLEGITFRAES